LAESWQRPFEYPLESYRSGRNSARPYAVGQFQVRGVADRNVIWEEIIARQSICQLEQIIIINARAFTDYFQDVNLNYPKSFVIHIQ
jgi:hypothetical protein